MKQDETLLISKINNYLNTSYTNLKFVNWDSFFSNDEPFVSNDDDEPLVNKLDVMLKVLGFSLEGLNNYVAQSCITNYKMTENEIEHLIITFSFWYDTNTAPEMTQSNLLGLFCSIVKEQKLTEKQFEVIYKRFEGSTENFYKEELFVSLATSDNLTQNLLERFIHKFNAHSWVIISKNHKLWEWYDEDLFYENLCPCTQYLNMSSLLLNNYIPTNILCKRILVDMDNVRKYLSLFDVVQFRQSELYKILLTYIGTRYEEPIFYHIFTYQRTHEHLWWDFDDIISKYPNLVEMKTQRFKTNVFKQVRDRMRLNKLLLKNGYKIEKDSCGREFVKGLIQNYVVDWCNNSMCTYRKNIGRYILNDDSLEVKELPKHCCFMLYNKHCDKQNNNNNIYYIYIEDMLKEKYSPTAIYASTVYKKID